MKAVGVVICYGFIKVFMWVMDSSRTKGTYKSMWKVRSDTHIAASMIFFRDSDRTD